MTQKGPALLKAAAKTVTRAYKLHTPECLLSKKDNMLRDAYLQTAAFSA